MLRHRLIIPVLAIMAFAAPALAGQTVYQVGGNGPLVKMYQSQDLGNGTTAVTETTEAGPRTTLGYKDSDGSTVIMNLGRQQPDPTAVDMIMQGEGEE